MVVDRLVRLAPAQGFERGAVLLVDPHERVVEREAGDVGAGLFRGGPLHVAPGAGAVDVAVDPFDEERLDVVVFVGERARARRG